MKGRIKFFIIFLFLFIINIMMASDFPTKTGIYKRTFKLENEKILRYTLYIPKPITSQKSFPLIMALHYGGKVTPYYGKEFLTLLIKPALHRLRAIMVAPDCPFKGWNNPTSESAVLALLNHIKKQYKINNKKVLLTGFSMGGIGTWYIAARHPHLFSAAIPISSTASSSCINMIHDIPIYVIHSKKDEIFPIKPVREMVKKLKSRGLQVKLMVLDRISHYQTNLFVKHLRKTIPWIKKVWKKNKL